MKILITGGCGFVGSNVALGLSHEHKVFCLDNLSKNESKLNKVLLQKNAIKVIEGNISDEKFINNLIADLKPNFIIHLAAQVAMSSSIENPINDFNINLLGTFNLLNSIKKHSINTKFLNISTNKVYGDLLWDKLKEEEKRYTSLKFVNGYDEMTPISFSGPYGCSKGSAEQYVIDYSNTFNLQTTSLRLSTIYGPNQYATFNQGWIGWFLSEINFQKNKNKVELSIHGNGKQVRDILYIDDFTKLIIFILSDFDKFNGQVFNVGGSKNQSISILELFDKSKNIFDISKEFKVHKKNWRVADQRFYISDISKIKKFSGWVPETNLDSGLEKFSNWIIKNSK